jgi:hypothetical protein
MTELKVTTTATDPSGVVAVAEVTIDVLDPEPAAPPEPPAVTGS